MTAEETMQTSDSAWAMPWESTQKDPGKRSLAEQAEVEKAVSSVGYENVLPGISLQYITSGSTLKEYIRCEMTPAFASGEKLDSISGGGHLTFDIRSARMCRDSDWNMSA